MSISLTSKIRIVFIFTFILLCIALFFVDKTQMFHNHKITNDYYKTLHHYIHKNRLPPYEIISYLEDNGFHKVQNPREIFDNTDKPIFRQRGYEIIIYQNNFYLHIITPHFKILFEDTKNKIEKVYIHFIVFGIIVLLLVFIYFLIQKNIRDTQLMLSSRQLFLRTVMHELKTPIAKGRIVSELVDNEKQQTRLINIFDKLNFLIEDFAKVEQIVSKNYQANFHNLKLDLIIQNSIDMLMLENTNNIILGNIQDRKLKVDLELFSMAIKNLLDNGLKYSTDKKVTIEYKNNKLLFISTGNPLTYTLEEYFKPFHNDTNNKNHGMGLGLYIVHSIVKMHSFELSYSHHNHQNIFIIKI